MATSNDILITVTSRESRVAMVENGQLQELYFERTRTKHSNSVGSIVKGKVARVIPGMQAAFVDIGLAKNGFLHARDLQFDGSQLDDTQSSTPSRIESRLHEGQSILVQIIKEPIGDKGVRLSMKLSVPSRFLVFLVGQTEIGVSQKIAGVDRREQLLEQVSKLRDELNFSGGFILRTQAEQASEDDLRQDMLLLKNQWQQFEQSLQDSRPGQTLLQEPPLALRALRDFASDTTSVIQIDDLNSYQAAMQYAEQFRPSLIDKLKLHQAPTSLFSLFNVDHQISCALNRRVTLDSGVELVIDQTEALTIIDVNTGSYIGEEDAKQTLLSTNLEASEEIARQLRLRNIGGIIIIDFIDMPSAGDQQKVMSALRSALDKDRVKTRVGQFSELGLLEVTRKRTRESLQDTLCEPCPVCQASGVVKTPQTVCHEILREVLNEAQQFDAKAYTVRVSNEVADLFEQVEADSLRALQEMIERPVKVLTDPHYQPQQYNIALA